MEYDTEMREFKWDIPTSYTIPAVVDEHAERIGDRVAVHYLDADGDDATRTYSDLQSDMRRFANGVIDLGVSKGDRIMHLFPRHPDAFAVQLGILAAGGLVVPCSSMLRSKDITFRANDCDASGIVVHESLTEMVEPALERTSIEHVIVLDGAEKDLPDEWYTVSELLDGSAAYDGPKLSSSDPMTINYTSGTTGQPKPVLHKHRWMYCFNRINGPYWWGITGETDLGSELLWATTGTGWAKWFWSPVGVGLTTGASQLIYEGEFEPERFLEIMESKGVTRLCSVPTQYRMFATADLESYDLAVTDFLSAGEPLNREPIERMEEAFGVTPRGGYGQTETVALVANYPGIDIKPGSMGRPLPGTETTIIWLGDETEVETGEIGEIAVPVGAPVIFDGYYEKPELDEETFSGAYYRTGDLASRDEDGYFFFEGRADDIILSSGYRIGPFEVEDALVGHDAVAEAAAVGSPHPERGSVVKTYVILAEDHDPSEGLKTELQEYMKAETAPYKYPRRIEFVDELPKTSSGKIRRIELRERERKRRGE